MHHAGKRLAFINPAVWHKLLQYIETGNALLDSNCQPGAPCPHTPLTWPSAQQLVPTHVLHTGWLRRMATNERSMEEFQAVHNMILEVLRNEKVRSSALATQASLHPPTSPVARLDGSTSASTTVPSAMHHRQLIPCTQVDTLPNGRQLTYGEYRDMGRPLRRMLKQLGAGSLEEGLLSLRHQETALLEVSQLTGVSDAVSAWLLGCTCSCSYTPASWPCNQHISQVQQHYGLRARMLQAGLHVAFCVRDLTAFQAESLHAACGILSAGSNLACCRTSWQRWQTGAQTRA